MISFIAIFYELRKDGELCAYLHLSEEFVDFSNKSYIDDACGTDASQIIWYIMRN